MVQLQLGKTEKILGILISKSAIILILKEDNNILSNNTNLSEKKLFMNSF